MSSLDAPRLALTFDDVLLVPGLSEVHPNDVALKTEVCRGIALKIPIVSAAMDTVTESSLAIALAQEGGIGIVHKNLSVDEQAEEVDKVKRSEAGMIVDPVTMGPDQKIHEALQVMARFKISGLPVTDDEGRLVGILTNRDLRFETQSRSSHSRADDPQEPRHSPTRHHPRRGQGHAPQAPHRETAGGGRR